MKFEEYTLRSGQRLAIDKTLEGFKSGKRMLTVLPTGYGKTIVISGVAKAQIEETGKKVIIVEPTKSLCEQVLGVVTEHLPHLRVIPHHSDSKGNLLLEGADIIVTLPESLANISAQLEGKVCCVVYDEGHHSIADTYYQVFCALYKKGVNAMGVTATPVRSDHMSLARLYNDESVIRYLPDGVDEGYLVSPVLHMYQLGENFRGQMLNVCLEHAQGGKTIVFCESIALCEKYLEAVTNETSAQGKKAVAVMVHCEMSNDDRKAAENAFKNDPDVKLIFNVATLREGFDHPPVSVVAFTGNVKSKLVAAQMIGRGARPVCDLTATTNEGRRAQIAASSKPTFAVLDFHDKERVIEEHPLHEILKPYKAIQPGTGEERELTYQERESEEHFEECRQLYVGALRRMCVLTGDELSEGIFEVSGINEQVRKITQGIISIEAAANEMMVKRKVAEANRIRKYAEKLRADSPTLSDSEVLAEILSGMGIDTEQVMNTAAFTPGLA